MAGLNIGSMKPAKLERWDGETFVNKFPVFVLPVKNGAARAFDYGQPQITNDYSFQLYFKTNKWPNADWKLIYEGKRYMISEISKVDEKRFFWKISGSTQNKV